MAATVRWGAGSLVFMAMSFLVLGAPALGVKFRAAWVFLSMLQNYLVPVGRKVRGI